MMKPQPETGVPEETARVAKAAFPKGNPYLTLRDELGSIFQDEAFAGIYPSRGQPGESPGRLALVTVLQFAEGLSDRQAAEAVRSRIEWKYLLGMELTDSGFNFSVLSEFRSRLIAGGIEQQLLDLLIEQFKERGILKPRGRQRTDSTHVEASIRDLNRLELVGETIRHALNSLAEVAPQWLRQRVPTSWYEEYGPRFEEYRLPRKQQEREALALKVGQDGYQLLNWVYDPETPVELRTLEAVETLRRVWIQQYYQEDDDIHRRKQDSMPPSEDRIVSPYDVEARYSVKRKISWIGYKAHITEVCDDDQPHLITHVETTPATLPDNQVTSSIHQALAEKALLPREHLLDTGYVDAKLLVESQAQYEVEMVGPPMPDVSWQARAGEGYDLNAFQIDWDARIVTCPQQQVATSWKETKDNQGNPTVQITFGKRVCDACPVRQSCTKATRSGRKLRLRPQPEHETLQRLRRLVKTDEFKKRYQKRAGVEGTLSQGVRSYGLRRTRYVGLAKAHLQNILTAAAINLARFDAWFRNHPIATTRKSRFASLACLAT
jgi:transposase